MRNARNAVLLGMAFTALSATALAQSKSSEPVDYMRTFHPRKPVPAAHAIWGFNPIHVTNDNVGLALSYERFLDEKGIFSLYLPVSAAFAQARYDLFSYGYYGGWYGSYGPSTWEQRYSRSKGMVYFYPGIKIYPAGANKRVSYALGTSLIVGVGSDERTTQFYSRDSVVTGGLINYTSQLDRTEREDVSRFRFGVLITNSLNIRPTNSFYIGLELGVGYSYMDLQDGEQQNRQAMVQAGVKLGLIR